MGRAWRPWLMAAVMQHCFILVCFREVGHVAASHAVYKELQSVSASYVGNEPRTGYHFRPPKHWINDPNGPMYYKGFYHLFYQYNPKDAVWGNIVWAHSVSRDLINWESLDPAIYPSKVFDVNGCWSGSATILPGNKPVIMYTGIDTQNRQVQNVAFPKNLSDPYLREWIKPDYNPVIQPKAGINASSFRDPTTAWYGSNKHWMLAVGSKWDRRGKAILYRSKDFMHWIEAKHPLHSSENTGMWECPDFYPVPLEGENGLDSNLISNGVKHVLKVSLDEMRYEYYTIGTYDLSNDKYMPDGTSADDHTGLRYDYGNFYASKTFFDPVKGRRILWGWANESDTADNDKAKGWAGIQAIPRTVWLHSNGRQLLQWPIAELETLRRNEVFVKDKKLSSGEHFEVTGINTAQADVELAFDVSSLDKAEPFDPSWSTDAQKLCGQKGADVKGGVGPFGLFVLASADMSQRTAVFFRIFKAQGTHVVLMCHDPTRSTTRPEIYKPTFAGFVDSEVDKTGKISLRSLIDNSVVESFGEGGKTCITSRVYPTMDTGSEAHMFVFNNGATDLKVSELKAWQMGKHVINGA